MKTVRAGRVLITFDGEVVEVFGWTQRNIGFGDQVNVRFHVALLELVTDGPDRKGERRVTFRAAGSRAGCDLLIEDDEWFTVGPFVESIRAAIPG
jgi:hypothetical protein